MEKFDNPYARLFYAVYKLRFINAISEFEKVSLKGMIARGEHSIVELLNHYAEDQDADALSRELVKIARPMRNKPASIITKKSPEPEVIDESSSPLGNFLRDKKKRQVEEYGLKIVLVHTDNDPIEEINEEEAHNS
jgi:hypothetical protein